MAATGWVNKIPLYHDMAATGWVNKYLYIMIWQLQGGSIKSSQFLSSKQTTINNEYILPVYVYIYIYYMLVLAVEELL